MSTTTKVAIIAAAATIIASIIAVAPKLLRLEKTSSANAIENRNSNHNTIIQNSQNISIGHPNETNKKDDQPKPEDSLEKIFINANERFIESIFGIPAVTNKIHSTNSKEVIYSFERFYLQFLYDENGRLFFYSLTSKDVNFHPAIPGVESLLGKSTFHKITNDSTHLYSYLTSKHYGYGEFTYLGNRGNYHNYYLAYNSAGVDYNNPSELTTYVDGYENQDLARFRTTMRPNAFGVGSMEGVTNDDLIYEIGVSYFTFRNEPLILEKQ